MMDDHIIDNDDLQRQNPSWKPSEWIGCRKAFKEIPRCVAIEFERIQLLPPEAQSILPSEAQSPAAFYTQTNLPTWSHVLDTRDLWADLDFSSVEPSHMPATLVELSLLPNVSIRRLQDSLSQALMATSQFDFTTRAPILFTTCHSGGSSSLNEYVSSQSAG